MFGTGSQSRPYISRQNVTVELEEADLSTMTVAEKLQDILKGKWIPLQRRQECKKKKKKYAFISPANRGPL